jgi:hypothetical protein
VNLESTECGQPTNCLADRHRAGADTSRDLPDCQLISWSKIAAHEAIGYGIEHLPVKGSVPTAKRYFG